MVIFVELAIFTILYHVYGRLSINKTENNGNSITPLPYICSVTSAYYVFNYGFLRNKPYSAVVHCLNLSVPQKKFTYTVIPYINQPLILCSFRGYFVSYYRFHFSCETESIHSLGQQYSLSIHYNISQARLSDGTLFHAFRFHKADTADGLFPRLQPHPPVSSRYLTQVL